MKSWAVLFLTALVACGLLLAGPPNEETVTLAVSGMT